jgi:tetratricopeptide (TPR) repeat protein
MNKSIEELFELVSNQKFDEAIIHLNQFVKKDKNNWNAWHLLGQAYRFKNDFDKAIECNKKAYTLNKEFPPILLALGIAYQLNENYINAIESLEKAINLDASYAIAYNSLALTYKRIGDLEKSLETFDNGFNAIAKKFFISLNNSKQNKIHKHRDINGVWIKCALQGATYLAVKLGYSSVLLPTAKQAMHEESTEEHGGLYWIEKDKGKAFEFLPNLLNTFREHLRGNKLFISMLRDQGLIYEMLGIKDKAYANYQEAEYFEE